MTLEEITKDLEFDTCYENIKITGLNTLQDAIKTEISFFENKKYVQELQNTKAGAVLITDEFVQYVPKTTIALICKYPYINLAILSKYFKPKLYEKYNDQLKIDNSVDLQPNVYIGKNSTLGTNTTIMAGSYIGDNVKIGSNCIIYPNVTIYRDCVIGNDTIIHSGTVIGSDGFGFATTKDGQHIKIYQNGNVIVGNNVEIGANCAIDRAAFKSTIINDMVRLDNLVHIAHNCIIGKGSIITGQCGLAGSSVLDQYVVIGAQSGVAGHLNIAPFTTISAKSGVTKSIKEPHKQWAGFPLMDHKRWLRLQGKISRLLK